MPKAGVENEKLKSFVIMPEIVQAAFKSIPTDHTVDVRYPQEMHGLSGQ